MHDNIDINVSGPVQAESTYKTVVLKGNQSFASQVTEPYMKYVVKFNFDLGGRSVTFPVGCLVEFDGGSISNGTLVGNNTILIYNQALNAIFSNVDRQGTFIYNNTLSADEEDLTEEGNLVKFKNKEYNAANYSGLGRVYLRKNIVNGVNTLTQKMINKANTIYHIQYDYTLGEDITVPANCVLEFDGGSINDGTVTGQNTYIFAKDKPIFENIHITGNWNVPNIYSSWFGGITNNNILKELFNLSSDSIYNNIYITPGIYNVSTPTIEERFCLQVKSNTKLEIDGTIQLAANNQISYNIININNKKNVIVCGSGTIVGDKNTHTGTEGEWGHGIGITEGCENIEVYGLTVKDCWGDCIAVDGDSVSKNINIHDFVLDNGRRQGISVIFADSVKISNGIITNISGTEPYAAIDIEPNANGYCKNIYINNVKAISEKGFLIAQANSIASSTDVENVYFENCYVEATEFAIDIRCGNKTQFTNCTFKQNNTEERYTIMLQSGAKKVSFNGCNIETNTVTCFYIGAKSDDTEIKNSKIICNKFAYFDKVTKLYNNTITCTELRLERAKHIFTKNNVSVSGDFIGKDGVVSYNDIICSNASFVRTDAYNCNIQCDTFITNGVNVCIFENRINAGYVLLRGTCAYNNTFINSKSSTYDAFVYIQNTQFKNNYLDCSREDGEKPKAYVISQISPSVCEENVFISNPLVLTTYYTSQDDNVFKNNTYDDTKPVYLPTNANSSFKDNNIGTTRPTLVASKAGFCFFDKNLNPARPIWWNGSAWVDATGATV